MGASTTANKYVDMRFENYATQRKIAQWSAGSAAVAAGAATASSQTQ